MDQQNSLLWRGYRYYTGMGYKSPLLKYDDKYCDVEIDGCGSFCYPSQCSVMAAGACRGCIKCSCMNACPPDAKNDCNQCWTRCPRRKDIADWEQSINGYSFDGFECKKPFSEELPPYIPQIHSKAWNFDYPYYIINVARIIHRDSRRWLHRRRGVHYHYQIPKDSKVIISFCTKDAMLEEIWLRHQDWQDGEDFWSGFAKYDIDAAMSIEFSCFADSPRIEHAINMKRNIMSCDYFSSAGVPVIMDTMYHSPGDFERMMEWSVAQDVNWHTLNFQYTKKVPWMLDRIQASVESILSINDKKRVLLSGIADLERVTFLLKKYKGRVSITNFAVYMHTLYHRRLNPVTNHWIYSPKPLPELWAENMTTYLTAINEATA